MSFKELWESIKKIKHIEIIAAVLIIAVILCLYASTPGSFLSGKKQNTDDDEKVSTDTSIPVSTGAANTEEARLAAILSNMEGAGKVDVMITYATGPEIVPAMDRNEMNTVTTEQDGDRTSQSQQTDVQEKPMTVDGPEGSEPMVLYQETPEIKGVIVIAEGANNIEVYMNLERAVMTILNVRADQVEVFAMESIK
jgi:stage III sporulation protein AG